ncbi:hypothetical protein IFM89_005700 [Coptis chinensis]|uniref:Uncharacterized protein n=1 Tax=Coptis chinensis TaxID=261450 RepID=A0A835I097_9MAGN|nr:hypothetical protein IFM89_005700 [Coptis chinensis]
MSASPSISHPPTNLRNRKIIENPHSLSSSPLTGPKNVIACFIAQHTNLWGAMVSYTITSATSMRYVNYTS